jgi:feruloyl esterase
VGQQHTCPSTNGSTTITQAAATVAKATLKGPVNTEGGFLWYGLNPGTSFKIQVATECNDGTCIGVPLYGDDWIRDFLLMDPSFDVFTVNTTAFDALFHQAINRYDSIIGTSDVDLRQFRNAGGKLITWHGLADTHIPPGGTEDYVKRVYKQDPKASEYYRYFEAPGVGHCTKGSGWYPGDGLKALIDWVENGIAPETLEAETVGDTEGRKASLCMWPKRLVHVGGDASNASSFGCQ